MTYIKSFSSFHYCIFMMVVVTAVDFNGEDARIFNGIKAKMNEFRYMAAVLNSQGHVSCGGMIITEDTILTAASCIE